MTYVDQEINHFHILVKFDKPVLVLLCHLKNKMKLDLTI